MAPHPGKLKSATKAVHVRNLDRRFATKTILDGVDLDIVHDSSGPYDIPNVYIDFTRHEAPDGMRTGNWLSLIHI